MKILTAEQMREADRRTIEAGIPGIVLMENAGCRVVEFLEKTFAPLERQRVVVVCGKGNNGGDGLVIARQRKLIHHAIHRRAIGQFIGNGVNGFIMAVGVKSPSEKLLWRGPQLLDKIGWVHTSA